MQRYDNVNGSMVPALEGRWVPHSDYQLLQEQRAPARGEEIVSYTVMGCGEFPIDMLRYGQAWPQTPEDAMQVANSLRTYDSNGVVLHPNRAFSVRVNGLRRGLGQTFERWQSFGCRVADVNE